MHEYLTVRGVIGKYGIACSALLRSTISDDLDMEDTRRRAADSLTLLGLRPDSLQADSDPHLRASPDQSPLPGRSGRLRHIIGLAFAADTGHMSTSLDRARSDELCRTTGCLATYATVRLCKVLYAVRCPQVVHLPAGAQDAACRVSV